MYQPRPETLLSLQRAGDANPDWPHPARRHPHVRCRQPPGITEALNRFFGVPALLPKPGTADRLFRAAGVVSESAAQAPASSSSPPGRITPPRPAL